MTFQELDSSKTPPTYSICFSAASTLRCDAPSHLQLLLLLIPPALEIALSLFLVLKEWRSASMRGKGFWCLLAEGWLYTALAVADVVARIYPDPAGRVTRIIELVVGAFFSLFHFRDLTCNQGGFSTLSLLLYTVFLFMLLITSRPNPSNRGPLISSLPTRLQAIAKALIVIIIPFLLTSNAFSNFFGISFSLGHAGFTTPSFFYTHTFLAALTLALLSLFSALSFLLFAYQSLLVLTHDSPDASSQERVHLMCGLPYLALGTKLAFIEAIAGFAPMAFPGVLFRRILRFGGRTALVWGGIRGLDWEEDFQGQGGLAQVLKGKGNGMLRIGSPRALSPREDEKGLLRPVSSTTRYQGMTIGYPYAARDSYTPTAPPKALIDSGSVPVRRGRAGDRVTVHYQQGYAPHLEVRLSGLGVPDTGTLVRNIKEQGLLDDVWDQSEALERKQSIREMRQERKQKEREYDQISQVSGLRVYSISSEDWNIVRFSTPPNTSPSPIPIPPPVALQRAATTTSNSSSLRRKPAPALLSPLPRHGGIRHSHASGLPSPMTAASQATFASAGTYQTRDSGDWLVTASKGRYAAATYRTTAGVSLPMPPPSAVGGLEGNPFSPGPGSTDDVDNYNENSHYRGESNGSALSAVSAAETMKIKAIRTAPHKVTPPPTRVGFWRNSVEIERGVTPSRSPSSEYEVDEEDSGEGTVQGDVDFGVDSPTLGHAV